MSRAVKDIRRDESRPGNDPAGTSRGHPDHRGGAAVGRQSAAPSYDPDEQSHMDLEKELYKHGGRVVHHDHYASGGKPATKWIAKSIQHPGAETRAAKKAGVSTQQFMQEHKHDSGTSGKRARLGLTLSKMNKSK